MAQYISKGALLAEIDRQKIGYNVDGKHSVEYDITRKIIDIINTFETKNVNLGREFNKYFNNFTDPKTGEKLKKEECWLNIKQARRFAKHFFELGLKAQKGE